jgi:hypothetical protein
MKKLLLSNFYLLVCAFTFAQNGLHFDGVNDIITTNYPGILGNNARTMEAWVKTSGNFDGASGGVQGVILDWGTFNVNGARSTFNISTGNTLRFEISGSGVSGTVVLNDDAWHHVAAVYDPSANPNTRLYVDGVLDVAGNLTIPVATTQGVNVRIGERIDGLNKYSGVLDEVRVWNSARSAAQIQSDMNNQLCVVNDPNLKLYYTFNQGNASFANTSVISVLDWSSNAMNGTLVNFALTGTTSNWVTGKVLGPGFKISTITANSCTPYTWSISGQTYPTSGLYKSSTTSTLGCDSIITLNLIIRPKYLITNTVSACNSYQWGSNGATLTSSGTYYDSLSTIYGCDSIRKLVLTITAPTSSTQNMSTCASSYTWPLNGQTYLQNGAYTATIANAAGCDSIVTLNLTLSGINNLVTNVNGVLQAEQTNASYQWIDCATGNEVPFATAQTLIPQVNGEYAVIIQLNNCSDTSECLVYGNVGLNTLHTNSMRISPNPSNGVFQLNFGDAFTGELKLSDVSGRLAHVQSVYAVSETTVDFTQFGKGIWLVTLQNSNYTNTQRIIIE